MSEHVIRSVRKRTGILTLDRPQALHSLSLDMVRAITAALLEWRDDDAIDAVIIGSTGEKAFCAGGDIRFFYQAGREARRQNLPLVEDFFTEEYLLNQLIHRYPKPYIALMDGIVMGGGMGISQGRSSRHVRIVTERSRLAMPEVNIGLFPDVGGSYFLSRCPGETGTWLALTANAIGAADALYAGLADVFMPSAALPDLVECLCDASGDIAALARAGGDTGMPAGELAQQRARIDRHFAGNDMAAILASLAADPEPFAQATLASIRKRSPLMLCATLEQLRRGAGMTLEDCLRMERSMMRNCFAREEMFEGIRAAVIDKDQQPAWVPSSLEEVAAADVTALFRPAWPAPVHPLRFWLQAPAG